MISYCFCDYLRKNVVFIHFHQRISVSWGGSSEHASFCRCSSQSPTQMCSASWATCATRYQSGIENINYIKKFYSNGIICGNSKDITESIKYLPFYPLISFTPCVNVIMIHVKTVCAYNAMFFRMALFVLMQEIWLIKLFVWIIFMYFVFFYLFHIYNYLSNFFHEP